MKYYLMLKEKIVAIIEISKFHIEVISVDRHIEKMFKTFDEQALAVMNKNIYTKLKSIKHLNIKNNIHYKGISDKRKELLII